MHRWTGFSRDAIRKRFDLFGLGKTADPREVFALKTLEENKDSGSLEEARKRQAEADAHLKELQAQKLQSILAPVDDLRAELSTLFDSISAVIRKSNLDEDDKQDVLTQMSDIVKEW